MLLTKKIKSKLAVLTVIVVAFSALTSCGSPSFKDLSGTYKCTQVIVNMYGLAAGYEKAEMEEKMLGRTIKITADGKLIMNGQNYTLVLGEKQSENITYVYISGNGYTGGDTKPKVDFDGPLYFYYTPKGKQVAADVIASSDYINMYYTPSGTSDWYFAYEFYKV